MMASAFCSAWAQRAAMSFAISSMVSAVRVAQVEPGVEGDLVVAAAGGVQLAARVAQALGEDGLDEAVYVLRARGLWRACPSSMSARMPPRPSMRALPSAAEIMPVLGEHRRVGHAAPYVLPVHPAVDGDGRVEVVRRLVQRRRARVRPRAFPIPFPPVYPSKRRGIAPAP